METTTYKTVVECELMSHLSMLTFMNFETFHIPRLVVMTIRIVTNANG